MKQILGAVVALLVAFSANAAPPSASLSWSAPTTYTDGQPITVPITYSVYQGPSGGAKTKVLDSISALSAAITSGLSPNSTVCWELTASAGGQESARSNEACKTFPAQTPEAPVLLVE